MDDFHSPKFREEEGGSGGGGGGFTGFDKVEKICTSIYGQREKNEDCTEKNGNCGGI